MTSPSHTHAQKRQVGPRRSSSILASQPFKLSSGSKERRCHSSQFSGLALQAKGRCHVLPTSDFYPDLHLSRPAPAARCSRVSHMRAPEMGIQDDFDRQPLTRGERVAAWVDDYLRIHRISPGELALRIRADKRDVRRLVGERTCGSRLEDSLAAYFGWVFVEAVFSPVIGGDPLTCLEQEIERERQEMAARENRLERLRSAVRARTSLDSGGLRLVSETDGLRTAPRGRGPGNLGA